MASSPSVSTFKSQFNQASEIQSKSLITGFYLKNYILTQAVEFLKSERSQGRDTSELTREVQAWFQELEGLKKALGSQLQVQEQSRKQYYDFAYNFFLKCNSQYQNREYSPQLANDFSSVALLFTAYSIFNSPSKEVDDFKNYANNAANNITQALKTNQQNANPSSSNPSVFKAPQTTSVYTQGPSPYQTNTQNSYNPQGHSQYNQPQPNNFQQQNANSSPFGGFQAAESTYVPKSALDQTKSGTSVMGRNPMSNNTTTSVFHQGPPQGFPNQSQGMGGQYGAGGMASRVQNPTQAEDHDIPVFTKFAQEDDGNHQVMSLSQAMNQHFDLNASPQQSNPSGFGGPVIPNVRIEDSVPFMPKPETRQQQQPSVNEKAQPSTSVQQDYRGTGPTQEVPSRTGGGKTINLPKDKTDQLRDLCMMTISELDYKNLNEAKENLRTALRMLKELDPSL